MEKRYRRRVTKHCSIRENCSSFASEKKKREPRASDFQPKTTLFWVVLLFFFLKFKNPKTTSFWASNNQNDAILCIWILSLKQPSYLDCTLKPSKKPIKYTFKVGLKKKEEEEEDSKRFFYFYFLLFFFSVFLLLLQKKF